MHIFYSVCGGFHSCWQTGDDLLFVCSQQLVVAGYYYYCLSLS